MHTWCILDVSSVHTRKCYFSRVTCNRYERNDTFCITFPVSSYLSVLSLCILRSIKRKTKQNRTTFLNEHDVKSMRVKRNVDCKIIILFNMARKDSILYWEQRLCTVWTLVIVEYKFMYSFENCNTNSFVSPSQILLFFIRIDDSFSPFVAGTW